MAENEHIVTSLAVLRSVEVEGLSIEMGVLSDGTPFLSGKGLAKACGISNEALFRWGELTPSPEELDNSGKLAKLLTAYGYRGELLLRKVISHSGEPSITVYPADVCMAFLEYYSFEANNEEALKNFRLLARHQLSNFIFEATGYVVMAAEQEIIHLPSPPAPGQPLPSRAELRSHQKLSKTSTLETLKQLREEARY
ncbi:MAG: hypothetical protein ACFB0G_05270 [Leptolyngbyaceae cyanobacterium]